MYKIVLTEDDLFRHYKPGQDVCFGHLNSRMKKRLKAATAGAVAMFEGQVIPCCVKTGVCSRYPKDERKPEECVVKQWYLQTVIELTVNDLIPHYRHIEDSKVCYGYLNRYARRRMDRVKRGYRVMYKGKTMPLCLKTGVCHRFNDGRHVQTCIREVEYLQRPPKSVPADTVWPPSDKYTYRRKPL